MSTIAALEPDARPRERLTARGAELRGTVLPLIHAVPLA
jgi:hypothetical protein